MSDNERDTLAINDRHKLIAKAILNAIKEFAETPLDGVIALLMVHAKLWVEFGNESTDTMIEIYVKDFYTLAESYRMSAMNGESLH